MINSLDDLVPRLYDTEKDVDWKRISIEQLSDDFISKYQNKLDWSKISMRHKLSEGFIQKFKSLIIWSDIIYNPTFKYDLAIEYINFLDNNDLNRYIRFNMNKLDKLQELRLIKEITLQE